jgi:hypothetical protein
MKSRDLGLISLAFILLQFKLSGQTVEPSSNVLKNNLQLEIETLYSVEKESSMKTTSWNVPNVLIRFGLSKNVELQLHTPFTKERCFINQELTSNIFKFNEVEFGVSFNLWKQNKFIPEAAIMARMVAPTINFSSLGIGNIVSLNFSNVITSTLSFNYNIGTTTSVDKNTTGFYVLNVGYEPNSKIHFFIENASGFTFNNIESNCLGTGFGVNITNNWAIDFSMAKSLKNNMFYTGAILTWVINTKKTS